MQHWTPDQRRQQISEMLRNKGIICKDYLLAGQCPRSPCPYMHIMDGETRPVPWSICTFFNQGKCLRDRCAFFHGSLEQLEELHSTGVDTYRPQDYMRIAEPSSDFLNSDGTIAVDRANLPPFPSVLSPQFFSLPDNRYTPMMLFPSAQPVSSPTQHVNTPIGQTLQYHYIPNTAYQPNHSVNTYAPVQTAQAVPGPYAQGGPFYVQIQ